MVRFVEDAARSCLPWLSAASAVAGGMLFWPPLGAISVAAESLLDLPWSVPRRPGPPRQLGDYRLLQLLGGGAMGEVWRAEHLRLKRPAAVKLIRPERLEGGRRKVALLRFEREARAMARLSSPHVVTVFDYGQTEDGTCFYAMELLDGLDLETLIERRGPLSPLRTVRVLRQVVEALGEAHQQGLVHRDIKPANVMLCRRGLEHDVAKLLDFGVAAHPLASTDPRATGSGLVVGTPATMAPEVIRGLEADARSDVYSLGCVAYWCLTGRYPFEAADTHTTFTMHLACEPVPPSRMLPQGAVPAVLDALVLACLDKNPTYRPQSMESLGRRLERLEGLLDRGRSASADDDTELHLVPPRPDRDVTPALQYGFPQLRCA